MGGRSSEPGVGRSDQPRLTAHPTAKPDSRRTCGPIAIERFGSKCVPEHGAGPPTGPTLTSFDRVPA